MRSRDVERGAAAVEFALVLPLLLLLLFGIIDFGRMLAADITLVHAAHDGARAAALVDEASGRAQVLRATAQLDGLADVDVSGCDERPRPGSVATVELSYDFTFVTPLASLVGIGGGDGSVNLTAEGVMACLG